MSARDGCCRRSSVTEQSRRGSSTIQAFPRKATASIISVPQFYPACQRVRFLVRGRNVHLTREFTQRVVLKRPSKPPRPPWTRIKTNTALEDWLCISRALVIRASAGNGGVTDEPAIWARAITPQSTNGSTRTISPGIAERACRGVAFRSKRGPPPPLQKPTIDGHILYHNKTTGLRR
jgi:hypothetical protein